MIFSLKDTFLYLFIAFSLSSCFSFNEYLTESDYSYDGKFKRYKTFDFVKITGAKVLTPYENNSNQIIEENIRLRMQHQGYKQSSKNPNLIISYRIFNKNFDMKGYNQPEIDAFVNNNVYEKEKDYDPIKYPMREGTLLVILFDRKQGKSIWQGYASGLFNDVNKGDKNIKKAVRSIFDRYRFLAEGFAQGE